MEAAPASKQAVLKIFYFAETILSVLTVLSLKLWRLPVFTAALIDIVGEKQEIELR